MALMPMRLDDFLLIPTDWMYMPSAVFLSRSAVAATTITATINGVGTGIPGMEAPRVR